MRVCIAIGGSTNATVHLQAVAEAAGAPLSLADWRDVEPLPLLVNCQPIGQYLGEEFHRAGGVRAVIGELLRAGAFEGDALTVTGRTMAEENAGSQSEDREVIGAFATPFKAQAGFRVMTGNFFRSAVFKASAVSDEFQERYLNHPDHPGRFTGRAIVFEGPEDYHARINDPALAIDETCILVMRGCGPVGYPGSAEVVNMSPPDDLLRRGVTVLPCIGDGRQSGTSASPSLLHVAPEAAVGGDIGLIRTGDLIEIDLPRNRADLLVSDLDLAARRAAQQLPVLADQTPWQTIYRRFVSQLDEGASLNLGESYGRVAERHHPPRHSH
jgi:dihydroxy-acid dehydratase